MDEPADAKLARARRRLVGVVVAIGALVVVGIIAIAASGGSDSSTPSSSAGSTSTSVIAQTTQPGSSTTTAASSLPPGSAVDVLVTVAGKVKTLLPNGDFVVDEGSTSYTIAMSPTVTITDLNGATATADLIQLGGSVQVNGTLHGPTITAQAVIVPVRSAPPATGS